VNPQREYPTRILIADDQKRTRQSLRALLSASLPGLQILEASNGEEALRLAEEARPRLVVMDLRMPGLDGIVATRAIKSRWPEMKVLALSLYPDLQEEVRAAGADTFVAKGEPPERLVCAVSSLL
jgi:two-component system, NarL family, invasion response regulator UvrY